MPLVVRRGRPFAAILPALIAIALPVVAAPPPPSPPQYTLTDLGTLGGTESHAYFINKHGQVAGDAWTLNGRHAFLWDNGTMHDAGFLARDASVVTGLNDQGDVIFKYETSPGRFDAVLSSGGARIDLGKLPGDDSAEPLAINNRGQVVGTSSDTFGTRAFIWEKGTMTPLPTLGGSRTYAYLINDAGQAAGYAVTADGEAHAVLWDRGQLIDLSSPVPGSPCDCVSNARGLNARGDVVGFEFSFATTTSVALLWSAGSRTVIATNDSSVSYIPDRINDRGEVSGNRDTLAPGGHPDLNPFFWSAGTLTEWNRDAVTSRATAMNRDGQVVGEASNGATGIQGFVWDAGQVTELAWPGYSTAADINDRGVIVGSASIANSGIHAVMWTPVQATNP